MAQTAVPSGLWWTRRGVSPHCSPEGGFVWGCCSGTARDSWGGVLDGGGLSSFTLQRRRPSGLSNSQMSVTEVLL